MVEELKMISSEEGVREAYRGAEAAQAYVDARFSRELMRLLHERQVARVQEIINQARPARTLEIAPGPGRVTRDIRPTGELICVEFNTGMIDVGQASCSNGARWVQGNAFDLPFDQEFDFVYSFRFVRHFQCEDRIRLYEQFHRALRPGGWFIMDAVNAKVSGPLRTADPSSYPIYDVLYSTPEELRDELRSAGFEIVSLEPVQRWFSLQYKAEALLGPRSRRLSRWTIRLLERLRRGPALEWIVTCRRG